MQHITRTVWILSLVSFFTDTASEMLYPVMPIYLKTVGFSVLLIGVLEGIAEAAAGLSTAATAAVLAAVYFALVPKSPEQGRHMA